MCLPNVLTPDVQTVAKQRLNLDAKMTKFKNDQMAVMIVEVQNAKFDNWEYFFPELRRNRRAFRADHDAEVFNRRAKLENEVLFSTTLKENHADNRSLRTTSSFTFHADRKLYLLHTNTMSGGQSRTKTRFSASNTAVAKVF